MQKIVKLTAGICLLLILWFLFSRFYASKTIPDFEYSTTNGRAFTREDLMENKKTVFIYYTTDCSDCSIINEYLDFFKSREKDVIYVLVAKGGDVVQLISFFDMKKMTNFKGHLLLDADDDFPSDFSLGISISYPVVKAYDKNGKLLDAIKELEGIRKI